MNRYIIELGSRLLDKNLQKRIKIIMFVLLFGGACLLISFDFTFLHISIMSNVRVIIF